MPINASALKPKEKHVLSSCVALLEVYKRLGALDFFRVSTTGIPTKEGGFRKNSAAGFPDILVWIQDGPELYVEVKSRTGQLSPLQKEFKRRAEAMGRIYVVIRSSGELSKLLERALRKKNPVS